MRSVDRPPRLVHVTTTDMSLTLLLGPQLRAFSAAGYEVIGVSATGPHVETLTAMGVRHVTLHHATRAVAPRRDLRAFAELRRIFSDLGPSIVHTHNPKPGVYGRIAARAARVPVVVNTVHGLYATPEDSFAKRAFVYSLEALAIRCSDAELVQNPEDLPILERLGPGRKLHVLGNGIDLERFDADRIDAEEVAAVRAEFGAGPDDVVCGLVGRLVREKGYREVFAAVRALRDRMPRVRFVVVGPTEPDKADALTTHELDEATRAGVVFTGERSDVERLYPAFDLYVLASYREGFPRSAMEAAAMGLPIVATDIRGCRQVVDDGVTGVLVPVRDPGALTSGIERLASDPGLRARFGAAASVKARREFDQARVIDTTLEVYDRLLAR